MRHITLLLAMVALVSCESEPPLPTLDATEWLSVERTDGGEERPLVAGTRIRLAFAEGQVSASAGCNTIGGTYRVEDGTLLFEGGGMTEMGCDAERHAQDDWLAALLASRPAVAIEGSDLTLTAGDEVVVLRDREVADPDRPLVGTTWTVESIIGGGAVSNVPGGQVATLEFADDGTIAVDTGCNTGGGRYELDGSTLRVREVFTTLIGCPGPGDLERAVLGVLGAGTLEVEIEAGSLTLMAGDEGLGLRGD